MEGLKRKILVIGINCLPDLTGIGKYTGEMLSWLVEQGHEVTMITAAPYYPQWKVQAPYSGNWYRKELLYEGHLTIYRCPLYIPKNPSGLKRLMHEASFFLSAFFVVLRLLFTGGADVVLCIAPPFHLGFLGLMYRFFKKAKVCYHIQDLQIDAAKELKILKSDWIFSLLFGMERFILNNVDLVSTISLGMKRKVMLKFNKSVVLFPNWVDTESNFPLHDDTLKSRWGFNTEDKIVLYSGSIGEKQGLENILIIADRFKEREHIKFVICGTGPFKERLIERAFNMGLKNVIFMPLQEKKVFNEFLNLADIHLVLQKGDAGDLVMPSKLTAILAVGGLVLVTADPGTSLYDVIDEHNSGILVEPESLDALYLGIQNGLLSDSVTIKTNARNYAEKYLSKNHIMKDFQSDLFKVLN